MLYTELLNNKTRTNQIVEIVTTKIFHFINSLIIVFQARRSMKVFFTCLHIGYTRIYQGL